jgi:putative ABC transport system permease protein
MTWWRRRQRDQDLERELRSDLELEAEERREGGLSVDEARHAARKAFGNATLIKEEVRGIWGWNSIERFAQDVRLSLRALRRSPGFVLFAVLALALGLGANAAIFSVVDAVLLRPLPFGQADRLVEVWEDASHMGFPKANPAPANLADWKRRNHAFADMQALRGDLRVLTGAGTPEQLEASQVTANLFPLLGVSPILGRKLTPEEDRPGGPRVVLIGFGLWQRHFAGDPAIVGREIWLNNQKYTVLGVMPRGVTFPRKSELWLPLALGPREWADRNTHYLRVFARLKPGVTLAQARREMASLAAQLAAEYPETNTKLGALVVDLRDQLVGDLKPVLWAVAAGVGCVLLIACANLAGLLLTRAAGREREFAVRVALGAGRVRLIRQALIESLVLGVLGGAAGILMAIFTLPFLRHLVPAALNTWSEPRIDLASLAFVVLLSVLAALLFGTLPALVLSRPELATALRQGGGRVAARSSTRTRKLLIVSEVAMAVVLLVGAGLLTRTLWALAHVPLGFHPEGLMTMRTTLPLSPNSPYSMFTARSQFYQRVLDGVSAIPGVISAGYTTFLPLTNAEGASFIVVEDAPPPLPGQPPDGHRMVSADYFRAMGTRLLTGRSFRDSDGPDAPPVAIINEAMARRYWPGRNSLGRRFRFAGPNAHVWFTIVGVVENIRQMGLDVNAHTEMYFPFTQPAGLLDGYLLPRDLAVRVKGDPKAYTKAIEAAVWTVDRDQPIADVMPMEELIADKLLSREVAVKLIGAFAGLALLLAALGLYGLLAYAVSQRRREIGVRMALGAEPRQVSTAILAEGLRLVVLGLVLGVAGSEIVMRALKSLLYGVAATDAWVLAASTFVLLLVAVAASYLPARRASTIDPVSALRYE